MNRIVIIFSTLTGNTQIVAELLADKLKKINSHLQIHCQNVADISPESLTNLASNDLLLIGSSTWDEGQYPYEMKKFLTDCQIAQIKLEQLPFGTFGCGDSSYGEYFCLSVDNLSQLLTSWGAKTVISNLKIDGFPEMEQSQIAIEGWVQEISQFLATQNHLT